LLESDRLKAVTNLEKYQKKKEHGETQSQAKTIRGWESGALRGPRTENTGKFETKWTRPYMISKKTRLGTYRLSGTQGRALEHSWNAENLHRFYI
jgi:hypothetical protein